MKKGKAFLIIGLLLIAAALCLIGYNIFDNMRAGNSSDEALQELTASLSDIKRTPAVSSEADVQMQRAKENIPLEDIMYPDYVLVPEKEMPVKEIKGELYIGTISIPALDLELPVISEWSYPRLKKSPCRFYGSIYTNDMVIAAHNYRRHFRRIKDLDPGDAVIFTDIDGNVFEYSVIDIETLNPSDVDEMINSDADLTLFTCTLGGRTRVTVRCMRKSD